ncbi:hypothetical protein IAU60_006918 [Kwoniella sp. DSM 27419]
MYDNSVNALFGHIAPPYGPLSLADHPEEKTVTVGDSSDNIQTDPVSEGSGSIRRISFRPGSSSRHATSGTRVSDGPSGAKRSKGDDDAKKSPSAKQRSAHITGSKNFWTAWPRDVTVQFALTSSVVPGLMDSLDECLLPTCDPLVIGAFTCGLIQEENSTVASTPPTGSNQSHPFVTYGQREQHSYVKFHPMTGKEMGLQACIAAGLCDLANTYASFPQNFREQVVIKDRLGYAPLLRSGITDFAARPVPKSENKPDIQLDLVTPLIYEVKERVSARDWLVLVGILGSQPLSLVVKDGIPKIQHKQEHLLSAAVKAQLIQLVQELHCNRARYVLFGDYNTFILLQIAKTEAINVSPLLFRDPECYMKFYGDHAWRERKLAYLSQKDLEVLQKRFRSNPPAYFEPYRDPAAERPLYSMLAILVAGLVVPDDETSQPWLDLRSQGDISITSEHHHTPDHTDRKKPDNSEKPPSTQPRDSRHGGHGRTAERRLPLLSYGTEDLPALRRLFDHDLNKHCLPLSSLTNNEWHSDYPPNLTLPRGLVAEQLSISSDTADASLPSLTYSDGTGSAPSDTNIYSTPADGPSRMSGDLKGKQSLLRDEPDSFSLVSPNPVLPDSSILRIIDVLGAGRLWDVYLAQIIDTQVNQPVAIEDVAYEDVVPAVDELAAPGITSSPSVPKLVAVKVFRSLSFPVEPSEDAFEPERDTGDGKSMSTRISSHSSEPHMASQGDSSGPCAPPYTRAQAIAAVNNELAMLEGPLKGLQGKAVPQVLGTWRGITYPYSRLVDFTVEYLVTVQEYCSCFDFVQHWGVTTRALAIETLEQIHARDVLHNDLARRHVLRSEGVPSQSEEASLSGTRIIDFEASQLVVVGERIGSGREKGFDSAEDSHLDVEYVKSEEEKRELFWKEMTRFKRILG